MTNEKTRSRRGVLKAGAGFIVLAGVTGRGSAENCDDEADYSGDEPAGEGRDDGMAGVRAAHLSPDAPNVDIYVDGDAVLEDVAYRTVSDYLELEPGTVTVAVVPAGEDPAEAVIEEDVDVRARDYTIAVIGELADQNQPLRPLVLEDDNSPVEDGSARVRAVHAAPDAPAVDVVADGEPLFEGVEFGGSGYAEVPAGEYRIEVYPAGDRSEPVFDVETTFEARTVSTAFAVGYLDPATAPADEPFDLELVVDATPEPTTEEPRAENASGH